MLSRVERATARIGTETHEAVCYVQMDGVGGPSRACFVPRVGMVSTDEGGTALTLTSHTLR